MEIPTSLSKGPSNVRQREGRFESGRKSVTMETLSQSGWISCGAALLGKAQLQTSCRVRTTVPRPTSWCLVSKKEETLLLPVALTPSAGCLAVRGAQPQLAEPQTIAACEPYENANKAAVLSKTSNHRRKSAKSCIR